MDVQVNHAEWTGLSKEDQAKIQAIIQKNFKGSTVVGHATALPAVEFLDQANVYKFALSKPACTALCGVAEAAAVAACSLLSGAAVPVCVAASHAAGEFCRSKC
jgi:hypothetical protein